MEVRPPARAWPRLMLLACAAVPARAPALAEPPAEARPPIVVTGTHDDPDAPAAAAESVAAERLRETTALVEAEDGLRYLPSLLVRKRHIGDTQAPLATRTSGVGSSARSLVYADGVLLSALIGNNNSTASPRWGMVSPEEIERIEILYGPYSAAYPGNSIGAVVNLTTRRPDAPEASLTAATSLQSFDQYGSRGIYPAYQLAGSAGGRAGPLRLFAAASHVSSRGQPLAFVTIARPAAAGAGGSPVGGAIAALNRIGSPILVIGAGGIEAQRQDSLKLKLSLDPLRGLRLTWQGGLFLNRTAADAQTYLTGDTYAGTLNIEGRPASVPASAFSNNVYTLAERHWMQALHAEADVAGLHWRGAASAYRFAKDEQRIPSLALPAARTGGPGSIVRLDGTGWDTLDLSIARSGSTFGAHWDRVRLENERYATSDWRRGAPGALVQAARGRTTTRALWAQQAVRLVPRLGLTLGARYEWWTADRGLNFSLAPALDVRQPVLRRSGLSPKLSLRWRPARLWSVTLAAGQAWRFPTVQELYQAVATGPSLTVPDPNLRPERARSTELAIERGGSTGHVRLSLFQERIRDALIAQSAPLVAGSSTLFSYVQNIPRDRTRGAELAFEQRGFMSDRLDLSGSATLVAPKVVADPVFPAAIGKDIPQVPRRRATLVATWRQSERAAFTLAGRYASRAFGTIDNSDRVGHAFQGFEGYFVVDARAAFRLGQGWEAALGVENIGNRKYFIFHPFPQRTFTAELHLSL